MKRQVEGEDEQTQDVFTNKASQRATADKEFGAFEATTKGFGMKMLQKMGYKPGQGLGKTGEGRVNPVEVKLRPRNTGLGFDEEGNRDILAPIGTSVRGSAPPPSSEPHLTSWRRKEKSGGSISVNTRLREEAAKLEKEWSSQRGVKVQIVDLSSSINHPAAPYRVFFTELRHNLSSQIQQDHEQLEFLIKEQRQIQQNLLNLEEENKRTRAEIRFLEEEKTSSTLLQLLVTKAGENSTIEDFLGWADSFNANLGILESQLDTAASLFVAVGVEFLRKQSASHDPEYLLQSQEYLGSFQYFSRLNSDNEGLWGSANMQTPFEYLTQTILVPMLRRVCLSLDETQPRLAHTLQPWLALLPGRQLQVLVETLLLPRLNSALELAKQQNTGPEYEASVIAWAGSLKRFLDFPHNSYMSETFYGNIRRCLCAIIDAVPLTDEAKKVQLLRRWQPILPSPQFDTILIRFVIPRLKTSLQSMVLDPSNQDISPLESILNWQGLIPSKVIGDMLVGGLFPKLNETLIAWLQMENADFGEIGEWYMAWKSLLPASILALPQIEEAFNGLLLEINRRI